MASGRWLPGGDPVGGGAPGRLGRLADLAVDRASATKHGTLRLKDGLVDSAESLAGLVDGIVPPTLPLAGSWAVGLGSLLRQHPQIPDGIGSLVAQLDRWGELALTPDEITVDGESVRWSSVQSVSMGRASDILTSGALDRELQRLTSRLPPVPGRAWVVRHATSIVVGLCLSVTRPELAEAESMRMAPLSIAYRSSLRNRTLQPGIFATLLAMKLPAAAEAVASLALDHGAEVTTAPPSKAQEWAGTLRSAALRLKGSADAAADEH